jgi:hypothetical protein
MARLWPGIMPFLADRALARFLRVVSLFAS